MSIVERGIDVRLDVPGLRFSYGKGVFGPEPELRGLDAIRASLLDAQADGPDPVYSIAMDIGREEHREELVARYLLFGAVLYAAGLLGQEPVRSQGHVHAKAPHSGWSPPELFEVWYGQAIIYMQERCGDDPGRCFAVHARPGEHVIVPPGWGHFVANANPEAGMAFVALCDRQYGFEYSEVRRHGGLAWFPVWNGNAFMWQPNRAYGSSVLHTGRSRSYDEFSVRAGVPLYTQFAENPAALEWVAQPQRMAAHWSGFSALDQQLCRYDSADFSRI